MRHKLDSRSRPPSCLALYGTALAFNPAVRRRPGREAAATAKPRLPGDDFFNYVNGEWLAKTDIPADRSAWGATSVMSEKTPTPASSN